MSFFQICMISPVMVGDSPDRAAASPARYTSRTGVAAGWPPPWARTGEDQGVVVRSSRRRGVEATATSCGFRIATGALVAHTVMTLSGQTKRGDMTSSNLDLFNSRWRWDLRTRGK